MMPMIFAAMTAAFAALQGGRLRTGVACALVGLALAAALFLFEIHDPVNGFRLPWLEVRAGPAPAGGTA